MHCVLGLLIFSYFYLLTILYNSSENEFIALSCSFEYSFGFTQNLNAYYKRYSLQGHVWMKSNKNVRYNRGVAWF